MSYGRKTASCDGKPVAPGNAAGVRSRAYAPGPYSTLEFCPSGFVRNYLQSILADCNDSELQR